jgi:hypothetical protein
VKKCPEQVFCISLFKSKTIKDCIYNFILIFVRKLKIEENVVLKVEAKFDRGRL